MSKYWYCRKLFYSGPKSREKIRDKDTAFINPETVNANSEAMRLFRERGRIPDPQGHLPSREVTEKEAQEGDRGDAMGEREGRPRVGLTLLSRLP